MIDSFNSYGLEPWIVKQVLSFLNKAQTPQDLHVEDASESGTGYAIGRTVAARILAQRNALPGRRFTRLEQVQQISGLGQDKLHDLVAGFSLPAAEAFRRQMSKTVLPSNFTLVYDSIHIRELKNFHLIARTPSRLNHLVTKRLEAIAYEKHGDVPVRDLIGTLLDQAYLETFPSPQIGAYALALWFYRFDEDNWFSFASAHAEAEAYLSRYEAPSDRLELRLYKGFPNAGLLMDPISVTDLPVVVNYPEQVITIWRAQLQD
ncbi:MAG: hypothetical protein D6722_05545 [Bacteroidetes bacterium]|nr:MAG: hypothetical protein D6722_05545 [Bacteroidota bacterium]